jgi:hypothetical protein
VIIDSSIWVATMTGLAHCRAARDDAASGRRDVFQRQLDAQVAAGDHDRVERVDDVVQVATACGFSILAMTGTCGAELVHDRVHVVDVAGRADEGQRDHVDAVVPAPSAGRRRPSRSARDAHRDAGQVDALVVAHPAADDDLGDHVGGSVTSRP